MDAVHELAVSETPCLGELFREEDLGPLKTEQELQQEFNPVIDVSSDEEMDHVGAIPAEEQDMQMSNNGVDTVGQGVAEAVMEDSEACSLSSFADHRLSSLCLSDDHQVSTVKQQELLSELRAHLSAWTLGCHSASVEKLRDLHSTLSNLQVHTEELANLSEDIERIDASLKLMTPSSPENGVSLEDDMQAGRGSSSTTPQEPVPSLPALIDALKPTPSFSAAPPQNQMWEQALSLRVMPQSSPAEVGISESLENVAPTLQSATAQPSTPLQEHMHSLNILAQCSPESGAGISRSFENDTQTRQESDDGNHHDDGQASAQMPAPTNISWPSPDTQVEQGERVPLLPSFENAEGGLHFQEENNHISQMNVTDPEAGCKSLLVQENDHMSQTNVTDLEAGCKSLLVQEAPGDRAQGRAHSWFSCVLCSRRSKENPKRKVEYDSEETSERSPKYRKM